MDTPILQISYSLANIENVISQFWQYTYQYRVLAFSGDLGAGKTTFIHALCDHLGVEDAVSSPTFAIINEYHFISEGDDKIIYHMDWYRIKDIEDAINSGIEDILTRKDSYNLIEWPEKVPELIPYPHLWINITTTGPEERKLEIWLREHTTNN